jgi:hypothetical protein
MKIDQKSTFHPREDHILALLDITVMYTIFRGFKNIKIWFKTERGSLRFYREVSVRDEN